MKASDLLDALLDDQSFRSWDVTPSGRVAASYEKDLARARAATGLQESVLTGEGLLGGRRVAVAVGEFGFLGGSIGVAAGGRLTACAHRATDEGLPLIVAPASGGTRMQEGALAFLQMVKITAAVTAHKDAGLPYLVYLRHPTTGGVFASWASLGHVTAAEPGALIGFLGPRVHEALEGAPFPPGVQIAENLRDKGLLDAVVPAGELAGYLDQILTCLAPADGPDGAPAREAGPVSGAGPESRVEPASGLEPASGVKNAAAWESVLRTREPGRPGARELIAAAATDVATIRDGELLLVLGRVGRRPCVLAGQRHDAAQGPAALRLARRGMRLAAGLRIPLITVIDTPGAELSARAEEDGIAREIAECIAGLITLPVPTVSVLLGQGTGGGALALFPADRVLAAANAWLAPLAPEGASAIVYKDTGHAAEMAARQGIRAADLAAGGAVDRVVPEAGDFIASLAAALRAELAALVRASDADRMAGRLRRYR